MATSDPNSEKESNDGGYRKVIVNIPKPLLDEFDAVCDMNFYTRKEAIKQSMRDFIKNEMGEEWTSPSRKKYEKDKISEYMEGLTVGAARASQNPEILKLQQKNQQQTQLPQKTKKLQE